MSKNITKSDITEQSLRLKSVILKHFRSQKQLADKVGVRPADISRYLSGRDTITARFAQELQGKAGISANYILNGIEPMMLDITAAPIIPKYDGAVPLRNSKPLQIGWTHIYSIAGTARRAEIKHEGEVNVAHFIIGDTTPPNRSIYRVSNVDYKEQYGFRNDVALVVDVEEKPVSGDLVLVAKQRSCHLCYLESEGKLRDKKTNEYIEGEIKGIVLRVIVDM